MSESELRDLEALRERIQALEREKNEMENALSGLDLPDLHAEVDHRSIYVGNVDYETDPQELGQYFSECGLVNRVTILCDETGHPKGFGYLEFAEARAVPKALRMDGTMFRGRPLKVCEKRTNLPGVGKGGRFRPRRLPSSFDMAPRRRYSPYTPYNPRLRRAGRRPQW
eukprot:NODE_5322_length_669_cov_253.394834_g5159_i0.p1 GENE.NODE_5322_length_669_cov_253.394834_g5159_i0~~NODE_5322_length_669_cov_253.394834_g5159_i0.p1  ORF type:complete len:169 (+),score=26.60 NODE_5322_length_669_cov_253.394834_g5159_i0:60-566(+)